MWVYQERDVSNDYLGCPGKPRVSLASTGLISPRPPKINTLMLPMRPIILEFRFFPYVFSFGPNRNSSSIGRIGRKRRFSRRFRNFLPASDLVSLCVPWLETRWLFKTHGHTELARRTPIRQLLWQRPYCPIYRGANCW